ncbi:hypothetical protein B0F90DRAFT_1825345 [Multifurca ochricompacta]|uniref:Uncharacterized protein n=1 Tax=Multifurca ochricompacta TaxID=376703 RepID=A0AAD4LW29_9AGAM|nr:hypothetical protein B0F90DRAFT_1825345 [Multifurca ochricompacta]
MLNVPFPSSGDIENVTLTRGGKRTRPNALKDVTNSSNKSLLKRLASSSSSACQPPVRITILQAPKAPAAPAQNVRNTTPLSVSKAPASKRPLASVLKSKSATPTSAPLGQRPTQSKLVKLAKRERNRRNIPKIVVHEPVWWDFWTDVNHPGKSYGKMLDIPALGNRGKMDDEDLAHYYPKEYSAEQAAQRLRSMVRSASRRAAVLRRERARTTPTST